MNCGLHKVRAISFEFDLTDSPDFNIKYYPKIAAQIAKSDEQPDEVTDTDGESPS
jgi:hypothetical protein